MMVGRRGIEPLQPKAADLQSAELTTCSTYPPGTSGRAGLRPHGAPALEVFSWSRRRDSNPEPAVYKTAALPIELRRRKAQEHTAVVSEAHRRSYGHGPFLVKRGWYAGRG